MGCCAWYSNPGSLCGLFKIKYFGTIASLGNLAERSSHFIAPLVLIRNCVSSLAEIKQLRLFSSQRCNSIFGVFVMGCEEDYHGAAMF